MYNKSLTARPIFFLFHHSFLFSIPLPTSSTWFISPSEKVSNSTKRWHRHRLVEALWSLLGFRFKKVMSSPLNTFCNLLFSIQWWSGIPLHQNVLKILRLVPKIYMVVTFQNDSITQSNLSLRFSHSFGSFRKIPR